MFLFQMLTIAYQAQKEGAMPKRSAGLWPTVATSSSKATRTATLQEGCPLIRTFCE
jgi:hypothetical protein